MGFSGGKKCSESMKKGREKEIRGMAGSTSRIGGKLGFAAPTFCVKITFSGIKAGIFLI